MMLRPVAPFRKLNRVAVASARAPDANLLASERLHIVYVIRYRPNTRST
jgi:hypothetical protein